MDLFAFLWLSGASLLAGAVYGFAGFGAALIFMPLAIMVVAPEVALAALSISAISSFVTLVPGAWKVADRRAALTMLGTAVVFIPLGLWILVSVEIAGLRWAVSVIALATLAVLVAGWRYRGTPGPAAWVSVGAVVGTMGGSTGLNGPALILFQLGGQDEAARTRANTIIVLTCSGLAYLPFLALSGVLSADGLVAGASQLIPYGVGTLLGRRLFNPGREGLYRRVAYWIIGVAGVMGLPIWS